MKVKIINSVIKNSVLLKKDAVHNLDDKTAKSLIAGGHAEEHEKEEAEEVPSTGNPVNDLMAKSKAELVGIANKTNKSKPGTITLDLEKSTKQQIAEAIAISAGYTIGQ